MSFQLHINTIVLVCSAAAYTTSLSEGTSREGGCWFTATANKCRTEIHVSHCNFRVQVIWGSLLQLEEQYDITDSLQAKRELEWKSAC